MVEFREPGEWAAGNAVGENPDASAFTLTSSSPEVALRELIDVLQDPLTKGTLNYYIGPGARSLHSQDTWKAIYDAVEKGQEALRGT